MQPTSRKLLIIEDDPIIAHIYRSKFEKEGYEVEVAADGQAGFYRLHETTFHAVLLDLMLPQINGLDILKKIRAQRNFDRLPVIVLTNAYLSQMALEASRAGASHVFYKATTSAQEIINAINRMLFLPMAGTGNVGMVDPTSQLRLPPGVKLAVDSSDPGFSVPAAPGQDYAPAPPTAAAWSLAIPPMPAPAPSAPPAIAPPSASPDAIDMPDLYGDNDILNAFLKSAPLAIGTMRRLVQHLIKNESTESRLQNIRELFSRVHSLAANANLANLHTIPHVGSVFEAFLQELCSNPHELNASTIQTTAKTIDFLGLLLQRGAAADVPEPIEAYILAVDDDPICLRAITCAVDRANLRSVGVEDPLVALKLLECTPFDMVVSDVDMPGLNGFELCSKLRSLPNHKTTPVVFVTALADFDSRALSVISGGNDLIAKPVMLMELAVKVVVYVTRAAIAKKRD
jgi:DNA-binding response OmpR family regulator